jgi:hypothetical protein
MPYSASQLEKTIFYHILTRIHRILEGEDASVALSVQPAYDVFSGLCVCIMFLPLAVCRSQLGLLNAQVEY